MEKLPGRYPEVSHTAVVNETSKMNPAKRMSNLSDAMRGSTIEIDGTKHDLQRVRTQNSVLEKKIEEAEKDKKSLLNKLSSLKVKLGLSNANLNMGNDEKERVRKHLNEAEIVVARLEERLSASSTELDRMRDPANPDSGMNIRKHVVNDKKELKRLRMELANEKAMLEADEEMFTLKEKEIKQLERELDEMKGNLRACEAARAGAEEEENDERDQKEELTESYKVIKQDRKTYEQRLKSIRVKLGISVSGQNVNAKHVNQMKKTEKEMQKQLNQMEKKLKDAVGELDILKNQHKLSKTALSINNYTKRTQLKRGGGENVTVSMAQSGPGPVKFTTKTLKDESKLLSKSKASLASNSTFDNRSRFSDGAKSRKANAQYGISVPTGKGGDVTTQKQKQNGQTPGAAGKRNSVQFVPPPKSKLKQTPR